MTQQISPFIEGKFGWDLGEGNWNLGMDENLLKFSFLFDRNIDGIVSSLPAVVNGEAYFLTSDNRLYFGINSTWYSTPTPKWFIVTIRSTGATHQFNGTSIVQVDSPYELDGRLDAVELSVSTVISDLANNSNVAKGAALVGFDGNTLSQQINSRINRVVNTITALRALDKTKYSRAKTLGYYDIGDGGSGDYWYDSSDTTSADNGGSVIVATDGGRWKLIISGSVNIRQFGAKADDGTAGTINTSAFQTAMAAFGSVYVPGGYYTINGILYWRSGLFLFGDCPGSATADGQALAGGARLLFTSAGSTCMAQTNPSVGVMHCGLINISFETSTRDKLMDMQGMLGWTISGVRMENSKVNGGGLLSQQIGSDPTWLNHCVDVEIRIPDASNQYSWDVDWSDSDLCEFALTGGKGAIDRGPGNMNYLGGIADRANSAGAGLWLTGSAASNKQTLVSNVKFDENDGYGLVIDAHLNTTGIFTPTITGCVFRNPSTTVPYDILLVNVANGSQPIMKGGCIVGNSFSLENRTSFNVDETTWKGITLASNRYPDSFATPFPLNTRSQSFFSGSNGISVPKGPLIVRSDTTIRGQANVATFATFTTGDAGLFTGCGAGGNPFIGASRTEAGVASALNFVTDNTSRLLLTANGTALHPSADDTMSLGLSVNRMTVIYATTGTINTSDAREKTDVVELNLDEINAAKQLSKEIGTYKWLTSIQAKGDDARLHIGMTVQRAIEIMEDNNLDPMAYGFICYDEWAAVEEETVTDEDGNIQIITPAVEAGNRYGFRYDQLNMFIAAGLEARLNALESM